MSPRKRALCELTNSPAAQEPLDPRVPRDIMARVRLDGADAGADVQSPPPTLERGISVVVCTYRRPASVLRFLESLRVQRAACDQLIIVDASPDDATERALRDDADAPSLARSVLYFRVGGELRGLTRQRNFALRWVATDLVAFFDDDIVLLPDCLGELERCHRELHRDAVGVGALIVDEIGATTRLWHLRRALRVVPSLAPGRYHRSGFSTPWNVASTTSAAVEGDWLHGGATMWKTDAARAIGFCEQLGGYGQGEDLEFSLRARTRGALVAMGSARVRHLHEASARPDDFRMGYMALYNRYQIHRRGLRDRTWRDGLWFAYAWALDTLLLARHLLIPRRIAPTIKQVGGRCAAAYDLVRGR